MLAENARFCRRCGAAVIASAPPGGEARRPPLAAPPPLTAPPPPAVGAPPPVPGPLRRPLGWVVLTGLVVVVFVAVLLSGRPKATTAIGTTGASGGAPRLVPTTEVPTADTATSTYTTTTALPADTSTTDTTTADTTTTDTSTAGSSATVAPTTQATGTDGTAGAGTTTSTRRSTTTRPVPTTGGTTTTVPAPGTVTDPAGDSTQDDLISASIMTRGTSIIFRSRFAPGRFTTNSHVSFLLDTDQNPSTGFAGTTTSGDDASLIGVDWGVEATNSATSAIQVFHWTGSAFTRANVTGTVVPAADGFDITIPASAIGGFSRPLNFKAVTQTSLGNNSYSTVHDVAPDTGLTPGMAQPPGWQP